MLNATFGEMIWPSLLSQPCSALAGEHIEALLIPFLSVGIFWEKIVVECPTRHIVQIQRPGLATFGINERDTPCSLIDLALIHPQGSNFTDAQPCPIAQREDGGETASAVLFDELLEHKALLLGEFGRGHLHNRWALHCACRITAQIALIHCPLAKSTQPGKRLAAGPRSATSKLERVHISTHRRFSQQARVEWCSSWLRGEPGDKATHRGYIGRDRFRVTRAQCLSELLKNGRIVALHEVSLFPELSPQKILRQDSGANFAFFPVVYNEAEHGDGENLTEKGYSPSSVLRRVAWDHENRGC